MSKCMNRCVVAPWLIGQLASLINSILDLILHGIDACVFINISSFALGKNRTTLHVSNPLNSNTRAGILRILLRVTLNSSNLITQGP